MLYRVDPVGRPALLRVSGGCDFGVVEVHYGEGGSPAVYRGFNAGGGSGGERRGTPFARRRIATFSDCPGCLYNQCRYRIYSSSPGLMTSAGNAGRGAAGCNRPARIEVRAHACLHWHRRAGTGEASAALALIVFETEGGIRGYLEPRSHL